MSNRHRRAYNLDSVSNIIKSIKEAFPTHISNIIFHDYLHLDVIRDMLLTPKTRLYNVVKIYFDSKYSEFKKFICGGMFGAVLFATPRETVRYTILTTYDLFRNYRQFLNIAIEREHQVQRIQSNDVIVFFNGKTVYAHKIIKRRKQNRRNGFCTQPLSLLCALCKTNTTHVCTNPIKVEKGVPMQIEEEFLRSTVSFQFH
jgi:hypothetical protein